MPAPIVAAQHPSAASDLARLAIPLLIITASIVASLWIDRGAMAPADEPSAVTPVSAQAATP